MTESPRLNGVIRALEQGKHAFATFAPPADVENAVTLSSAAYDAVVFEMEHNPVDFRGLKDCFQYMLNRRQIVEGGTLAPRVTPFVRIPPNGGEMNQWLAKQVLDLGAYGIVWPHISTVEQAQNAVAACRYPSLPGTPRYDPPGLRGDAPVTAARYWGLTGPDYYARADVWPLAPEGEIFVILMIEDTTGIDNLPDILEQVPGIGSILIGEGDLSQELGIPREFDHPDLLSAMTTIRETCKKHDIPCGHPHVGTDNVDRIVEEGYRFLMAAPVRSYSALDQGRKLTGRV